MIVEPYKLRPVPPTIALLREDRVLVDERGRTFRPADLPKGTQAWASLDRVQQLIRQGKGKALCWRGQPIRYAAGQGYNVRVLALPFPADDERALEGLCRWRDWLGRYGASPLGSLGSSSYSLLRATLQQALWTGVPFSEAPPIRFTIGGRQELGPAGAPTEHVGDIRHFDMRAAYARTLGELEYGGHWFRLHQRRLDEHAAMFDRLGKMVFCRARVKLPGTRPGPLVRRPRREPESQLAYFPEYPVTGVIQGVWTYPELAAATAQGAQVKLLHGWFHNSQGTDGPVRPFAPWWEAVQDGRQMAGLAGLLAKATGNALWGQFCISGTGKRQVLFYRRDGRRVVLEQPTAGPGQPRAHDLAEYLTGRVRAQLYSFIAAAGHRLVSAHTDGGWVNCTGGWEYHPWRSKDTATRLRVLTPQMLAYERPGETETTYVVAGWPADGAQDLFEREWARARAEAA